MDFSAKIVNLEKKDNKDQEIRDDTLHIQYGKEKMGSTKLGFTIVSKGVFAFFRRKILSMVIRNLYHQNRLKPLLLRPFKRQVLQRVEFPC